MDLVDRVTETVAASSSISTERAPKVNLAMRRGSNLMRRYRVGFGR